ncbi:hypothetical protein [Cryobacterium gelidum]|uniref:hypothetical protein n=1 Tax=Cryobacterium gelidum TaxID=1259164 RepID=UPI0018E0A4AC|nr:hypothetical protein [Cryobacterium gelidum]
MRRLRNWPLGVVVVAAVLTIAFFLAMSGLLGYHAHTDEVADDYAGLVGPMVITRAGCARPDGTPIHVDRELFVQFTVSDENASPYLARNIDRFTTDPASVDPANEEFGESNLMHTVNGYVFGNQPLSSVCAPTWSACCRPV